ncbi:MAG TPA: HAD-IIA family hydrolase [Gemmatimonadales bacterium]|nr:HAD-IIA family hydrolase [Gemmatimonadales bacterium]
MAPPLAYCFDLDGTLYRGDAAIPGAVAILGRLRAAGVPFRCLSNTSSRPRSAILARLRGYGFDIREHELLTATLAAGTLLHSRGHRRIFPLITPAAAADLAGFELAGGTSGMPSGPVDAVLVGDLGDGWSDSLMQDAFHHLMSGADFVAVSRDRYWRRGEALVLDCGAYVAGLEYAAGREAAIAGKPSATFYAAALASLGNPAPRDVAMVGDDPWSDVAGAQRAGMQGWFVASGKADAAVLASSGVQPDRALASVAELPV